MRQGALGPARGARPQGARGPRSRTLRHRAFAEAFDEPDKLARQDKVAAAKQIAKDALADDEDVDPSDLKAACLKALEKKTLRDKTLTSGTRVDGRDTKTVRPIVAEVGVSRTGPTVRRSSPAARPRRW